MAIAAMDVLRYELGLRVPEEVSVVSFDDVPQAAWPSYGLTTVRQSAARMVEATVDALMARIEAGDETPRRVEIEGAAHRAHFRPGPGRVRAVKGFDPSPRCFPHRPGGARAVLGLLAGESGQALRELG